MKRFIVFQLEVDPVRRITATDALDHAWFQNSRHLSSDNKEETLKTLEAFDARRKLKSLALVLIARKRLLMLSCSCASCVLLYSNVWPPMFVR